MRVYSMPFSAALGHGRYALMGHHLKPGTAPIPPCTRPSPLHPHGISDVGNPHVLHTSGSADGSAARTTTLFLVNDVLAVPAGIAATRAVINMMMIK